MKKLSLAIAASVCAMSAYAAAPNPITLNVEIKGEVPPQDFFDVTVNSGDLDNVVFTHSEGWAKGDSSKVTLAWKVRSSYGPVRMLPGNMGEHVYIKNASGDAMQVAWHVSMLNNVGMEGPYFRGRRHHVLDAEVAKTGGLARLALWAIPKAPRPGTYSGTLPVVFETGFED
ncbi:hypothetical protein [Burkholderia ambifaria]|uniref:hypothetical protein n=1 Tax=Burkholderia ambifaria TaxID=152480 RepID=UPI002FDF76FD